ncbi:type II secretion system F family protein [Caballeronia sp. BR00000012568055]|uniref:type II secretion system F family protein n=1 Tax=Caballeronia sp. BR00000012568055 TaxID=2918761 RepID=UPI0023F7606F|nr:type II secretion system F family protein [Caballeronia sp. BR00000012568055]
MTHPTSLTLLTPNLLAAFAVLATAIGMGLIGLHALSRYVRMQRSARTLDQALTQRAAAPSAASSPREAALPKRGLLAAIGSTGTGWLDTPIGRVAVAEEDRRLLDRCGYLDARARGYFLAARIVGAIVMPLFVLAYARYAAHGAHGTRVAMYVFIALSLGFMAPKWFVKNRASLRQSAVNSELPMFVDLLRLLQGVGLSLDQSLQVMISDFKAVLPVMSRELAMAQAQFATGRTREQSLKRLSTTYDNDDLAAIVRLVIQVEQHGGAVQEPLRQFGDRLRDGRRAMLRERIGKLTVKMTGVMVITLLPALLIVTAGPGFIAIVHSLAGIHR